MPSMARSQSSIRWPRIERFRAKGHPVAGCPAREAPRERLVAGRATRSSASASTIPCAPMIRRKCKGERESSPVIRRGLFYTISMAANERMYMYIIPTAANTANGKRGMMKALD